MTVNATGPGRLRRAGRTAVIAGVAARVLLRLAGGRLLDAVRRAPDRRARAGRRLAAALPAALEQLGPAYVKVGQLLATRADLVPPEVCRLLGRLHDDVRFPPGGAALDAVPDRLAAAVAGGRAGLRPIAAGSIACVFTGRLAGGPQVAVKVLRPGITAAMDLDLALLLDLARLAQRLPMLRGAPVVDIMTQLTGTVREQLDLLRESISLRRMRTNLAALEGLTIPAVLPEWSSRGILVTEYVPGLTRDTRLRLSAPAGTRAARTALHAVYHMLFLDGFVHCDLHPGNLYAMPDGAAVIIDAGFARQLTDLARRRFSEFFYHLGRADGPAAAEVLLSTALRAGPDADGERFRREVTELVATGSGRSAAEFDLVAFAFRLFATQRACGYYADAQFIFPILALIVLEGTVRDLAPDLDFQAEAMPYVLRGLAGTAGVRTRTPGR